jgi:hypothetical protein
MRRNRTPTSYGGWFATLRTGRPARGTQLGPPPPTSTASMPWAAGAASPASCASWSGSLISGGHALPEGWTVAQVRRLARARSSSRANSATANTSSRTPTKIPTLRTPFASIDNARKSPLPPISLANSGRWAGPRRRRGSADLQGTRHQAGGPGHAAPAGRPRRPGRGGRRLASPSCSRGRRAEQPRGMNTTSARQPLHQPDQPQQPKYRPDGHHQRHPPLQLGPPGRRTPNAQHSPDLHRGHQDLGDAHRHQQPAHRDGNYVTATLGEALGLCLC